MMNAELTPSRPRVHEEEEAMSDFHLPSVAVIDDAIVLRGEHTPEQLEVAKQVGYHNYFRMGLYEAVDEVARRCPAGWAAAHNSHQQDTSRFIDAIRVGQVCVHSGDSDFILLVYRKP